MKTRSSRTRMPPGAKSTERYRSAIGGLGRLSAPDGKVRFVGLHFARIENFYCLPAFIGIKPGSCRTQPPSGTDFFRAGFIKAYCLYRCGCPIASKKLVGYGSGSAGNGYAPRKRNLNRAWAGMIKRIGPQTGFHDPKSGGFAVKPAVWQTSDGSPGKITQRYITIIPVLSP